MPKRKAGAAQRMARADAMAATLVGLGFEPTSVEEGQVVASGKRVHVRVDFDRDVMEFAHAGNFDRWANSVDYVFHGIMEDEREARVVVRIAEDFASETAQPGYGEDGPRDVNERWASCLGQASREKASLA